jgi:uridine phosphorylase
MARRTIAPSELIINADGSVFHLHLKPGQVADTVVLVGDPARAEQVAAHFERRTAEALNREFHSITGTYRGRPMTVVSTGIGTDNIDIVLTELDALVNVDFASRTARPEARRLTLLRLGTCGALQPDLRIGDMVFSQTSVGLDNLLDYYADAGSVRNRDLEEALQRHLGRRVCAVDASPELAELFGDTTVGGITASAPGFYGPQGRHVRLRPAYPDLTDRLERFAHQGRRILNLEMESSAVAGLGRMLGHRAATLCTVIAQRTAGAAETDYRPFVDKMIKMSLDKLAMLK